ncbi:MAG: phosphoribosylglycinamide formyltransferase [Synergistaceae bacterium]|nr:phosphoribosylglycinamide formyltransferase [Synergistaceae bacterium]
MTTMAILISGRGSNMMALAERCTSGDLDGRIAFVASDRSDAPGLDGARRMGLPTALLPYGERGRMAAEEALSDLITREGVDWIVLAGFMRLLSPSFVDSHRGRIVNIHPSLLPSFPGVDAIGQAWEYGVAVTGVTIHLVDEKMDHGPILAQEALPVLPTEGRQSLEERMHQLEHRLYGDTLKRLFRCRLTFEGRRVLFDN